MTRAAISRHIGILVLAFAGCGDDGGAQVDGGVIDAGDPAIDGAADASTLELTEVVHAAAAGFSFSAMIDDAGSLWTFGAGDVGVLGNGLLRGPGAFHMNAYAPIRPLVIESFTMVDVAAGDNHLVALQSNGDVWAWGQNGAGQIGNDDQFNLALEPVKVALDNPCMGVAASGDHTLVVDNQGALWSWGSNSSGELGNGETGASPVPVAVDISALPAGIRFSHVAAGNSHSLALAEDGTLWSWGAGLSLGLGSTQTSSTPAQVLGENGSGFLEGIVAVAAGKSHSLALASDGSLWSWGDGSRGQVGQGSLSGAPTPIRIDTAAFTGSISKLRAGSDQSFVVLSDGAVMAWGHNTLNQLGLVGDYNAPTLVTVGAAVRDIAAGREHGVAIDSAGDFWGWGFNQQGELGIGTTTPSEVPAPGYGPSGIVPTAIFAGRGEYSFLRMSDGTSWGVGINAPQFSSSPSGGIRGGASPTLVPAHIGIDPQQVAGGVTHSLILDSAGLVWGYGLNNLGQLGDGTTTSTPGFPIVPVATDLSALPVGVTITKVAAVGTSSSAALASDGTVWTWGGNLQGQLGNGTQGSTAQSVPVQVRDAAGTGFLTGIVDLSAGANHLVALDSGGIAWTWGLGSSGQLGATAGDLCDTAACSLLPKQVCDIGSDAVTCSAGAQLLAPVQAIAAGDAHTLLLQGGQVLAFGARNVAQIGNGTQDDAIGIDVPVVVDNEDNTGPLANIAKVVASPDSSFAIAMDGSVYGWGNNANGQLAKEPTTTTAGCALDSQCLVRPSSIPELSALTLVDLQAGGGHVLALDDAGVVWSWGNNDDGQLGHLFDATSPLGNRISITPSAVTYLPQ